LGPRLDAIMATLKIHSPSVPPAPTTPEPKPVALPPIKEDVHIIIIRDSQYMTAPLDDLLLLRSNYSGRGYFFLREIIIEWKSNNPHITLPISDPLAMNIVPLDLTEAAFLRWMGLKYHLHWDMKRVFFQGVSGGGGSESANSDAELNPMILTSKEIDYQLKDNIFFKTPIHLSLGNVKFPAGSIVVFDRKESIRIVRIRTPGLGELIITLNDFGTDIRVGVGASALAEKLKAKYPNYPLEDHMNVSFEYRYFPSSPAAETRQSKAKQWIEEMISMFKKDFDWSTISAELQKSP
jgi:hypothetical protein